MTTVFNAIIEYFSPEDSKEGQLFGPYRDEASAILTQKLQEQLNSCTDEEDKQGAITDYLYDLYKKVTGKTEDAFVDEFSEALFKSDLDEPVKVPKFEVKRVGKTPVKPTSDKVINPSTGCKVAFGGRAFKRLLKEGLINEDGTYTEEGQSIWDETLEKRPAKIAHPIRKNGKINLGGDAYKKFCSQGWTYNEDAQEWTGPDGEEGSSEPEPTASKPRSKPSKKTSESSNEGSEGGSSEEPSKKEVVPHPTRNKATLVMGGRGYKKFISQGWTYDEDAQEWSQ